MFYVIDSLPCPLLIVCLFWANYHPNPDALGVAQGWHRQKVNRPSVWRSARALTSTEWRVSVQAMTRKARPSPLSGIWRPTWPEEQDYAPESLAAFVSSVFSLHNWLAAAEMEGCSWGVTLLSFQTAGSLSVEWHFQIHFLSLFIASVVTGSEGWRDEVTHWLGLNEVNA